MDKPRTARTFQKPSVDEVREYIAEKGYNIDAEHFIDHYEANGWKVGRSPMKDWKAAVRNWARNNFDTRAPDKSSLESQYDLIARWQG